MIGQGVAKVGDGMRAPAVPGMPPRQLAWGGLAFVALTAGVFWWLFDRVPGAHAGPGTAALRWGYLPLLLLTLPVETVTSAARIWLICRVLHPGVSFWTCVRSEWANVAISTLTPSQSGGGPGPDLHPQAGRRRERRDRAHRDPPLLHGHDGGAAPARALLAGLRRRRPRAPVPGSGVDPHRDRRGPPARRHVAGRHPHRARRVLPDDLGALGRPGRLRDWWLPGTDRAGVAVDRMDPTAAWLADLLYAYREDVRRFLRQGKACFGAVCLLSVAFLLARALMPYLCARFLGVEAGTLRQILESQVALIFLVFFAPTPGGAGIAEGASLWIMADIVPPGIAPYYTLLWRASTVYLAALAGALCLGAALARDARGRGPGVGRPRPGASGPTGTEG